MRTETTFLSHPTVKRLAFVADPIGGYGVILVDFQKKGKILALQGRTGREYLAWVETLRMGQELDLGHFYTPMSGGIWLRRWPRSDISLYKDLAVPPAMDAPSATPPKPPGAEKTGAPKPAGDFKF